MTTNSLLSRRTEETSTASSALKTISSDTGRPTSAEDPVAHSILNPSIKSHMPLITDSMFSMRTFDAERDLPIVYCHSYNMYMFGAELLHQFDTKKYGKIARYLNDDFLDTQFARRLIPGETEGKGNVDNRNNPRALRYLAPNRPIRFEELKIHHTERYVYSTHDDKSLVAKVLEIWSLNLFPFCLILNRILIPLEWQVAGTIFASHLAMQHGWALNLGGGFHNATADSGKTFCLFSDVLLAMKFIWRKHPLQKFMIIDVDAHQATGIEHDLQTLPRNLREMVFMLDAFNYSVQPDDREADGEIDLKLEFKRFTGDDTYLKRLEAALIDAFQRFKPTLIFYIAGQDVLKGDQLGLMNLSDEGLRQRDELVFTHAVEHNKCPIVMLLGGGYMGRGAKVQADSIRNLFAKGLIWGGHRSGQRSLTRPRNKPPSGSAKANGKILKHTAEVDAVSQSVSLPKGSGRRKKIISRVSKKDKK